MRHGQRDALRRSLLPLFLLALCALPLAFGFYLPGVAPTDYALGDEIRAKVLDPLKITAQNRLRIDRAGCA